MPKSLFITAGHQIFSGKGNGAHGVNGFDEAVEARKLVNDIIAHQKRWYALDAYTDSDKDSLATVINKQVAVVNECFVCVDVHFNAASAASATGTEVYIPKNYIAEELELARQLVTAISESLGIRKRSGKLITPGVKLENESQHTGLGILNKPNKAINVLLEICFITNIADVAAYRRNYYTLVQKLSDVLGNFRRD